MYLCWFLLLSTAHVPGYMGFPHYLASFSPPLLLAQHRKVSYWCVSIKASASEILVSSSVSPLKWRACLCDEIRYEISKTSRNRLAHCTDHVAYEILTNMRVIMQCTDEQQKKTTHTHNVLQEADAFQIGSILV